MPWLCEYIKTSAEYKSIELVRMYLASRGMNARELYSFGFHGTSLRFLWCAYVRYPNPTHKAAKHTKQCTYMHPSVLGRIGQFGVVSLCVYF